MQTLAELLHLVQYYLQTLSFCTILGSENENHVNLDLFLHQTRSYSMLDNLSLTWHWSPGPVLFLLIPCLPTIFAQRKANTGNPKYASIKPYHFVSFFSAIILMALVLLTPTNPIARTHLFSVHMAQAVILTTVCAPLV